MTGNQQRIWSAIRDVSKAHDACSEQSRFSETEPTDKTLQNLQPLPESQRAMQLQECISYQMVSSRPCKEHHSLPLQRGRLVFHVSCSTSSSSWHSLIMMCYNILLHNTSTDRIFLQMVIELKEADLLILSKIRTQKQV